MYCTWCPFVPFSAHCFYRLLYSHCVYSLSANVFFPSFIAHSFIAHCSFMVSEIVVVSSEDSSLFQTFIAARIFLATHWGNHFSWLHFLNNISMWTTPWSTFVKIIQLIPFYCWHRYHVQVSADADRVATPAALCRRRPSRWAPRRWTDHVLWGGRQPPQFQVTSPFSNPFLILKKESRFHFHRFFSIAINTDMRFCNETMGSYVELLRRF